jgi:hypothetical protein
MMVSLFDKASDAFGKYAAMDAPELPPDELSALQVRLWRWQVEQFGSPDDRDLVLGIVEECGELEEADSPAAFEDAVADILIYTTQLCTSNRLDFGTMMVELGKNRIVANVPRSLGRLAHVALKVHQRIRGYDNRQVARNAICVQVANLYSALLWEMPRSLDVRAAYTVIAERVMKRNWKKDPVGAGNGGAE